MNNSLHPPIQGQVAGIDYRVRFSHRRSLGLYVFPDLRVEARAPHGFPLERIEAFVQARAEWVRQRLAQFAARPPPVRRRYRDGEVQPLLGEAHPLRVQTGRPEGVWLGREGLLVRARAEERVPQLLKAWYRRHAERVFGERLEAGYRRMSTLGIPRPTLRVRSMRSRWGSCSRRARITLNLELVKYPQRLIDYVVIHELCHLREFNHGPRFYALMDRYLPDWRERRRELRERAGQMPVD